MQMNFRFSVLLDTQPEHSKGKADMLLKVASYILYHKLLKNLMDNVLERKLANYRII